MTYKDLLLHRHQRILAAPRDPGVLDYLALRNRDALRAWRERFLRHGFHPTLNQRSAASEDRARL